MERAIEVDQRLDRVLDRLRQVVGQRPDADASRSGGGACRRAASTACDIAGRDERHVDGQLLGHADEEQVGVERPAVDRMDLHAG